jgi:hypothetical protein
MRWNKRGEIGRLLVLGVGALADMNVEPEAGEALLGERLSAGEPVGGIDRFHDDGGDLRILAQDSRGEIADGGGDFRLQRRRLADAGIGDGDERHGRSPSMGALASRCRLSRPAAIILVSYLCS